MKVKDQTPEQLEAIAQSTRFKPNMLRLLGGDLDVEMRTNAAGAQEPVVINSDGTTTPLRQHFEKDTEYGHQALQALDAGPQLDTSPLDNFVTSRYGHNLPTGYKAPAQVDVQQPVECLSPHRAHRLSPESRTKPTSNNQLRITRYDHVLPKKDTK